jgi:glycosyltransferase involved in cell wall biosynthesis
VGTAYSPQSTSGSCIAVDLSPWLPGGEAGGAGVLALDLVDRTLRLAPDHRLLLLTSHWNHEALGLRFPGVERVQVLGDSRLVSGAFAARVVVLARRARLSGALTTAYRLLLRIAGRVAMSRITGTVSSSLRDRGVQVLFCPFSSPMHAEPGLPVVSIVYDLQHVEYAQFFAPEEIVNRDANLELLRRWSDVVVCISEHAREALIRTAKVAAERTRVIPIAIHDRLRRVPAVDVSSVRGRFGLQRDYVLYPANGWPHKNHRLLLVAFSLMRRQHPQLDVDLVLTGALAREDIRVAASRMGLRSHVHQVGYCTGAELAALYQGCTMVAFPSLYEGFGIPLLEAMWFGKPVACSATTSLPEVGGDAVRYFDPRKPEDIATAMAAILSDASLASALAARGRKRVEMFQGDRMAEAYLATFDEVISNPAAAHDAVAGVFADGWAGAIVRLAHAGGSRRTLELDLEAPPWLPHQEVAIRVKPHARAGGDRWQLRRGQRETLQIALSPEPGLLSVEFSPLFRPNEHGVSADVRQLACLCRSIHIVEGERRGPNLLAHGRVGV